MGGDDGLGLFAGEGVPTMAELWRGRIESVARVGEDLHVTLVPHGKPS
jgi:hypothetical protein